MHTPENLIYSKTEEGTAFLRMKDVPRGIIVEPTRRGRQLNSFWTVWLRHDLLAKTNPKLGIGVELHAGSSLITALSTREALKETVRGVGAGISPIEDAPIERCLNEKFSMAWFVTDRDFDPVPLLDDARSDLPSATSLRADHHYIHLIRAKRNPFPIRDLARMVEFGMAIHLDASAVK